MKQYYVYLLASCKNGQLYIGLTNNLIGRVQEHKNKTVEGFTKKQEIHILVYYEIFYEIFDDINKAIIREKRLKKWNRQWKINLIEKTNPQWNDLHPNSLG